MLAQSVPVGITISSPTTWFLIAVALVVLALVVSTRRANVRPRRSVARPAAPPSAVAAPSRFHAEQWSAAQARFLEDPRAGCEYAQTILTTMLRERNSAPSGAAFDASHYRAACETVAQSDASTEDLRRAFVTLHSVFDALLAATHSERRSSRQHRNG